MALPTRIILLIVFLILLIAVAVYLVFINKKLKSKIVIKEAIKEKENKYKVELFNIKRSHNNPKDLLYSIDSLSKRFISDKFEIQNKPDYSELNVHFKKKNNLKFADFTQKMLSALYSGEKIEKNKINSLINDLERLIGDGIPPKIESKVEASKKNQEIGKTELSQEFLNAVKEKIALNNKTKSLQQLEKLEKPLPLEINQMEQIEEENLKISDSKVQKRIEEIHKQAQSIKSKNYINTLPDFSNLQPLNLNKNLELSPNLKKSESEVFILDEEQIRDAYKELQRRFTRAYNISEKNKDNNTINKLNKFKKSTIEIVKQFEKDNNIPPLLDDIKKGAKLINSIENSYH